MPLTSAQVTSAKRHLGYNAQRPAWYPLLDTFYNVDTILSDPQMPVDAVAQVGAILDRLDALEARIDDAPSRLRAAKVSSIDLQPDELDRLWREVRRWRRELSVITGLPILHPGGRIVVA